MHCRSHPCRCMLDQSLCSHLPATQHNHSICHSIGRSENCPTNALSFISLSLYITPVIILTPSCMTTQADGWSVSGSRRWLVISCLYYELAQRTSSSSWIKKPLLSTLQASSSAQIAKPAKCVLDKCLTSYGIAIKE